MPPRTAVARGLVWGVGVLVAGTLATACRSSGRGCTADLSGKHTSVIGVAAASGEQRWQRDGLPLMAAGLSRADEQGRLRLHPAVQSDDELLLDPQSGETLETRASQLIEVTPTAPPPLVFGSVEIAVVGDELRASDVATGERRWTVALDPKQPGRSNPVLIGDTVMEVESDFEPVCP